MNVGGVRKETGRATYDEMRRLRAEVSLLRKVINTAIRNGYLIASHSDLDDLAYSDSGHTGFASSTSLSDHTSNTSNPHSVTAAQIGALTSANIDGGDASEAYTTAQVLDGGDAT